MKRVLQIIRDGRKHESYLNEPLLDGEQGNLQTLAVMAQIVREDREDRGIRAWIMRDLIPGVKGHDRVNEIRNVFEFARDRIVYRQDPVDVERVSDVWSTLYEVDETQPVGDCGSKSVFIATCCAVLGYKPYFVVVKQRPGQKAFNHVYVMLALEDDQFLYLDATPPNSVMGWEPASVQKNLFPIFS